MVDECPAAFFFGGSSWGCIYDVGAYAGLRERFGASRLSQAQWGGVSSGALAALSCALGMSPEASRSFYDELAAMARAYGVFGKMSIYHEVVLQRLLPDGGEQWKAVLGRLHLGVSMPISHFRLVSEWRSNEELREIMHASMHIPFYMTHRSRLPDGSMAIDGGATQNVSSIGGLPTCIISVASPVAHVRPSRPPSLVQLLLLCYAPASPAACDAAMAGGRADALSARLDVDSLQPLSPSLLHATPAALLPGPAAPRIALQRAICAAAWLARRAEELDASSAAATVALLTAAWSRL